MVPAFPMDGGRILRALLSMRLGRVRATEIAAGVGQAIAIVFGVFCIVSGASWQLMALAVFVYFIAGAELAQVRQEEARRDGSMEGGVWTAPPGYRWVARGKGVWQLAPIHVQASSSWDHRPWR